MRIMKYAMEESFRFINPLNQSGFQGYGLLLSV